MLAGLNALELGHLRMSVGYGTHKRGRPLSPIEVGGLLRRSLDQGVSLQDCAKALQLAGTGHIGRFLHILKLPDDLRHLVDWGAGKNFVGFTAAVELVKVRDINDQRIIANAILSHGLNSREVRQIAQLRRRSGRTAELCIDEVLGMRPVIEKHYVFVGSVAEGCSSELGRLTQAVRNSILEAGIKGMGLHGATARLGTKFFTLVGDDRFNASMQAIGKEEIESQLRDHISKTVKT